MPKSKVLEGPPEMWQRRGSEGGGGEGTSQFVVRGSKEKWCETCFPLQAELALCACVPKAVLLVPHK